MVNFAKSTATKLFMVLFFLCLGLSVASAKEPYADVFAFIQKMQTMHPLTIEKLLNEGFVLTSQKHERLITFEGTGPELADGTQLQSFDFRFLDENPSKTFLVIDITNICIPQEEVKKRYSIAKTLINFLPDGAHRIHYVEEKEAKLGFSFPAEKSACMDGFNIEVPSRD